MKEQSKQQVKSPAGKSTVKPQPQGKAKKQDELSIDELAKVSGGRMRKRSKY